MQKAIYFNVMDGGYALHGDENAEAKLLKYLKGISENISESSTDQYANGELVGSVRGATKITGDIQTTARDPKLEALIGLEIDTDVGVARTIGHSTKRIDLHYSYVEVDDKGVHIKVKVWLFNVELGKPTRNHETTTDSVTLGTYAYPYTAYGVKLKNADGSGDYVDENGLEVVIHDVESRPGDANYADFFKIVPTPKSKTAATPATTE